MDWLVRQADACCGEFIERIPLGVLAAMVIIPALTLGGWTLRWLIRNAKAEG